MYLAYYSHCQRILGKSNQLLSSKPQANIGSKVQLKNRANAYANKSIVYLLDKIWTRTRTFLLAR